MEVILWMHRSLQNILEIVLSVELIVICRNCHWLKRNRNKDNQPIRRCKITKDSCNNSKNRERQQLTNRNTQVNRVKLLIHQSMNNQTLKILDFWIKCSSLADKVVFKQVIWCLIITNLLISTEQVLLSLTIDQKFRTHHNNITKTLVQLEDQFQQRIIVTWWIKKTWCLWNRSRSTQTTILNNVSQRDKTHQSVQFLHNQAAL